jgi:hypothetical protein
MVAATRVIPAAAHAFPEGEQSQLGALSALSRRRVKSQDLTSSPESSISPITLDNVLPQFR